MKATENLQTVSIEKGPIPRKYALGRMVLLNLHNPGETK
jgi:membrane protein YdbS with pleckstrin-like domain